MGALLLAMVVALPIPTSSVRPRVVPWASPSAPSVQAQVTWDGVNVASAARPSSALSASFSSPIAIRFVWNSTSAGPGALRPFTVSTARLQLFYLGLALDTRDVVDQNPQPATNGTFDMEWDPGVLNWLLEGAYTATVSLLDPNGSTVWSEGFYLHEEAPYSVAAVLPILLLAIVAYEAYAVAISGRLARPNRAPGASGERGAAPSAARQTGPTAGTNESTDTGPPGPGGAT